MVFKKGARPPKAGEKQSEVPETFDKEAPSGEDTAPIAVEEKLYIKKEDWVELMQKVDNLKNQHRAEFNMSIGRPKVLTFVAKELNINDLAKIGMAEQFVQDWEQEQVKKRSGEPVRFHDIIKTFVEQMGFEVPAS